MTIARVSHLQPIPIKGSPNPKKCYATDSFFHHKREDTVRIDGEDEKWYCRLQLIFQVTDCYNVEHHLACVFQYQPMPSISPFHKLPRIKLSKKAQVISVDSVEFLVELKYDFSDESRTTFFVFEP